MRYVILVVTLAVAVAHLLSAEKAEQARLQKDFEEMRAAANGTTL